MEAGSGQRVGNQSMEDKEFKSTSGMKNISTFASQSMIRPSIEG
jgi:hypothetical protein